MRMARLKCDIFYCIGLIGFFTGAIMMFVGVGTANWLVDFNMTVGLFVRCNHLNCILITATAVETATKALISTGVVLGVTAATLAVLFLIRNAHSAQNTLKIPLIGCIISLIGGVLGTAGVLVYTMGFDESPYLRYVSIVTVKYGYSFYLSIAGSVILIIANSAIWLGTCRILKMSALQQRSGINSPATNYSNHQNSSDVSGLTPPSYENVTQQDPKLFLPPPDYFELMQILGPSTSQPNVCSPPPYMNSSDDPLPPAYSNLNANSPCKTLTG